MIELKPCPFCGSKAIHAGNGTFYMVRCTNCFAEISRNKVYERPKESACEAWNRRVNDAED